jgi:hypothetical protein
VYAESRESIILEELLDGLGGVLVSDFYTAYDSVPCAQQKCLIHLMRDINEDLYTNPFNDELKEIAGRFGALLREIVKTIDAYGLRDFSGVPSRSKRGEGLCRRRCLERNGVELPGVGEDGMPVRNGQRKPGTARGSPRRSSTAKPRRAEGAAGPAASGLTPPNTEGRALRGSLTTS